MVLASSGRISKQGRTRVETYNRDRQEELISCRLLDLNDLADIYERNLAGDQTKPEVVIRLQPKAWYILPESPGVDGRTLIATIRAKELVQAYEQWKDLIFGHNPRLFLGRNTQINRGIASTIDDPEERKRFGNYNNGVRATCDSFNPPKRNRLTIKSFQVVNGCQTTMSLWHKRNSLDDSVTVDMKVVEATDEKYWQNISKYTNSQAALQPRDFISGRLDQKDSTKNLSILVPPTSMKPEEDNGNSLSH